MQVVTEKKATTGGEALRKELREATSWHRKTLLCKAARESLPRIRKGETTLKAERKRLGLKSNGPLRAALIELMGSREAYAKMMHGGGTQRGRRKVRARDERDERQELVDLNLVDDGTTDEEEPEDDVVDLMSNYYP